MRRVVVLLMAVATVITGCAERQPRITGEPASPVESPTGTPDGEPAELPGASCKSVNAGNPSNLPDFVDVRLESDDGVDRVTFEFEPKPDAPSQPPFHFVSFVDELITEGEGRPVPVDGEVFLLVTFQAIGVDLSGEQPVEVYTGPKRFTPGFGTLKEVVHLGDFEAQVSWGLGLAREACFVLEAEADHLTLEFPSS